MILNSSNNSGFLQEGFNKKKNFKVFQPSHNVEIAAMQKLAKIQCMGRKPWKEILQINAWMLSAETATLMKWGGLGMVASELPENFNKIFGSQNHRISIVTPLYIGNTGKKKSSFDGNVYYGSEGLSLLTRKILTAKVPFINSHNKLTDYPTDFYIASHNNVDYILIANNHFFSINPHPDNPSAQDGCYVLNENNVNEVERFAFFSKAVYVLIKACFTDKNLQLKAPNILIANDWHSGALAGLCKYNTVMEACNHTLNEKTAHDIQNIPIIHIAHHLGYQGWDYPNTTKILNSLYEHNALCVVKNAKAMKNSNPRVTNTLIVYDCYNQASGSFHLADRVITVSKNYMEEVSKELSFGFDFRDILKIRKNQRTFFGIVNGYDKHLISPNPEKIEHLNTYFQDFDFKVYLPNTLENKLHNKKECMRLLSKLATDKDYKQKVIPLIDIYQFDDITKLIKKADKIPFVCATSRLVEQKGYDIAAESIMKIIEEHKNTKNEFPIFVLGGAGDVELYHILQKLKDDVKKISPRAAERIFVFRGYRDEFAYALQLAADFYLMPSRFEPCGLTQMEAMAKGCLPIAMSTGGLVDTIDDNIDGFRTEVFFSDGVRVYGSNLQAQRLKNNVNAYAETLLKALHCFYDNPELIKQMTVNAMEKDFSWTVPDGSVYKYFNLFTTGSV